MESVREILNRGQVRDLVRLACELSEVKERLERILARGVCPHCGARVFEPMESEHAETRE